MILAEPLVESGILLKTGELNLVLLIAALGLLSVRM